MQHLVTELTKINNFVEENEGWMSWMEEPKSLFFSFFLRRTNYTNVKILLSRYTSVYTVLIYLRDNYSFFILVLKVGLVALFKS